MNYQFADRINNLKPSAIREILKNSDPNVISLAAGNPAVESFPVAEMQEIANRIFNEEAGVAFQYGITEGYPRLRKLLRARLAEKFGMTNENDELLVVSGGQQGIDLHQGPLQRGGRHCLGKPRLHRRAQHLPLLCRGPQGGRRA